MATNIFEQRFAIFNPPVVTTKDEIPPDLVLSYKEREGFLELAQKLSPTELQALIQGCRLAQQKSGKSISKLKAAACVEEKKHIISSKQDSKKRYSFFIQTKENRARKKAKLEKGLKHLPKVAGWWRGILRTKAFYALPTEGDKEITLLKALAFFGWQQGNWTLNTWWGRVPNQALWEYAMAATDEYGLDHNPHYFIKCLHTAAMLWTRFPVPRVWREVVGYAARRFKCLSRNVLLYLLTAMMKALGKSGSFGDWVRRFLLSTDGEPPRYYSERGMPAPPVRRGGFLQRAYLP